MIRFICDTGCDIKIIDKEDNIYDFVSVPFKIIVNGKEFIDDNQGNMTDLQELLDKNTKGKTSSACPSSGSFQEAMEGADKIILITISKAVSGSYQSAEIAKKAFLETNPKAKVTVIDSKAGSGKQTLMLLEGIKAAKNGLEYNDICHLIKTKRDSMEQYFVLQNVKNLTSNGRLNVVIGMLIQKMKFSIVAKVNKEGVFQTILKTRGFNDLFNKLINTIKENGYKGGEVMIAHSNFLKGAEKLKEDILHLFPSAKISIMGTSCVCGYYAEKNGLTVAYCKN